jgi:hypothetical protein
MAKVKITVEAKVTWINQYSDTMEPDRHGRWARVAYCGNPVNTLRKRKVAHFQIAWVKRLSINEEWTGKFNVAYAFPTQEKVVFDTLDEAKAAVEKSFGYFIEMSINN